MTSDRGAEDPCDGPGPGVDLGDHKVYDLDGRRHRLRDLLTRTAVLETGSTTCPLYVAQVRPMQQVAARHRDLDFATLHAREAHPGEPLRVAPRFRPRPPRAIRALARGGRRAVWDLLRGLPSLLRHRLHGEAPC